MAMLFGSAALFLVLFAGILLGHCSSLICQCTGYAPPRCTRTNNRGPPINLTEDCGSAFGTYCYIRWTWKSGMFEYEFGCVDMLTEGNTLENFCPQHPNKSKLSATAYSQCCNNTNLCNYDLLFDPPSPLSLTPSAMATPSVGTSPGNRQLHVGLSVSLPLSTLFLIVSILLVIAIVYLRYRKKRLSRHHRPRSHANGDNKGMPPLMYDLNPVNISELSDLNDLTCTSGSGSGLPFLVQRTVARGIIIGESIGSGRFGQVFIGHYQGEHVAVKKFASRDDKSWFRETQIYNTVLLRHDNILGFFASDMISNNGVTELWLITQYHPHGSLFDYLNQKAVSQRQSLQMAISMCSGLYHLHSELFGTQGKPAIAHRDIKTKNILVKNNLTCCIADFGLAVIKEAEDKVDLVATPRQGTKRYMAPEILVETIDMSFFESFKRADIYALGLVLWELFRRCTGSDGDVDEYELPFQGLVPPDPSFDDMKRLVVTERRQPTIPNRWNNDEFLRDMIRLIRECWYFDPSARPSAFYLKKKLLRMAQEENKLNYSEQR